MPLPFSAQARLLVHTAPGLPVRTLSSAVPGASCGGQDVSFSLAGSWFIPVLFVL